MFVCLAVPLASAASPTQLPSITNAQLPLRLSNWIPYAAVFILMVVMVSAFVYALSSVVASSNAKRWARIQIYEALLSMILLLLFGTLSYIFFINPEPAYNAASLVPGACTSSTNMFSLSLCDLQQFNNNAYNVGGVLLWVPFVTGLLPGLWIQFQPWEGIIFSTYTPPLLPPSIGNIFSIGLKTFMIMMLLNQVQVYLLATAPFFLAFFITIGLVARTIGFTRSFGGAMIALGLGLGLVYPLLISITYGYIDVQLVAKGISSFTVGSLFTALLVLFSFIPSTGISIANLLVLCCYLMLGFTFIPFLNFLIMDAFIVDFSKAFGERLDFMTLLSGLV